MSAIFSAVAASLNARLSAKYSTTLVSDETWWVSLGQILVKAASVPLPWLKPIVDVLDETHSSRSVTLPTPGGDGAIIVYSRAAIADPLSYCVTITHEHEHARVLKNNPDLRVITDYAHPELRAVSEARAYACGAFTRYLLTGELQSADDVVAPLVHGYLLNREDIDTARSLVKSDLKTIEMGAVPPHEICHEVLALLHAQYPSVIVPARFKLALT